MRSLRLRLLTAGSGVLALLSATSLTVGAERPPDDTVLWEARAYSEWADVALSEAEARLRRQHDIGLLHEQVASAEPDTFAGLWIENVPDYRVVVAFTRDAEATLRRHVGMNSALAPYVEARTLPRSIAELRGEMREVAAASVRRFDAGLDLVNNRVEVYVTSRHDFEQSVPDGRVLERLNVIEVSGLTVTAASIYGGVALSTCTAGFTVRKDGGGAKGIVTAGHCPNSQSYAGSNLPYQAGTYFGSHDEQWHTAPDHVEDNAIRYRLNGSSYLRNITATMGKGGQTEGMFVCKHGKETNMACATIADANHFVDYLGVDTYIRVHHANNVDLVNPGDSGGPVFVSNTALGIIHGYYNNIDMVYTAISIVENGLGVSVLTQ